MSGKPHFREVTSMSPTGGRKASIDDAIRNVKGTSQEKDEKSRPKKLSERSSEIRNIELRMEILENENQSLKQKNINLKRRVEELLDKNKISKFVETRKKCLEGVEWRVKPEKTGGQLEGPSFYIRGYHLQLVGKVGDNLWFHVRRIPGEFDENLPPARLTYSSAEQVGREKTSNSTHEHKLDLYALSEEIDHGKCAPSILRFYFDIEEC